MAGLTTCNGVDRGPATRRLRVLVNDCLLEVQCAASQLVVLAFVIDAFAALRFGWMNSRNRPSSTFSVDSLPPVVRQEAATALGPMDACFELLGFRRLPQSPSL